LGERQSLIRAFALRLAGLLWSTSLEPAELTIENMSAEITSLVDLKKELQKNFADLEINFLPSE